MKKYILTTIFIILGGPVLIVATVNAQGLNDASGMFKDIGGQAGASIYENPEDVIGVGIGAAITLVGLIFLILMVYAGYLWMTARGEQEQVDKAQKIITTALIGFFIVASAYAITTFVSGKLDGNDSTSVSTETPDNPIDTQEECEKVGGGCMADYEGECDYDPNDPCDPGGLCTDPYAAANPIGTCELGSFSKDTTNYCCMKK